MENQNLPAYLALGRVVRAVAFPFSVIANLTVLELNALATISHIKGTTNVNLSESGKLDTILEMMFGLGTGQAFQDFSDYEKVFKSLQAKGLIKLTMVPGSELCKIPVEREIGYIAELTAEGEELIDGACLNLYKSLIVLDKSEVRESLKEYWDVEKENE
jgi:hypothetical protein